jgi:CelD/BcsL family acetyltransferase involved in cellulose biosynthesis
MWNCRFDPHWGKFSPGKLAMDESVANALSSGGKAYDFMRGAEPYKASFANQQAVAVDFHASSGRFLAGQTALFLAARARVRHLEAAGGRSSRLVFAAKGIRDRLGSR